VPPGGAVRAGAIAALYDLAHGDARTARRVLTMAQRTRPAPGPAFATLLVRALDASVAVQDRRRDARTLVARLDSILRAAPPYQVEVPNLVASALWERLGDAPRALAAARRRTRWLLSSQYLAPALRREARLAAATGDTAGAVRAYRHYVRLRADAEPALRPDLDAARAALARLERAADVR